MSSCVVCVFFFFLSKCNRCKFFFNCTKTTLYGSLEAHRRLSVQLPTRLTHISVSSHLPVCSRGIVTKAVWQGVQLKKRHFDACLAEVKHYREVLLLCRKYLFSVLHTRYLSCTMYNVLYLVQGNGILSFEHKSAILFESLLVTLRYLPQNELRLIRLPAWVYFPFRMF